MSTNGAGIAESAADVGWDTALRRWGAERPSNDPLVVGARASAGAGSREPYIGQVPAQSARTTPKIERVRAKLRRDVHHWILGVTGPIAMEAAGNGTIARCHNAERIARNYRATTQPKGSSTSESLEQHQG